MIPPFSTIALLTDMPEQGLARGSVGTVMEGLDEDTVLVEFSDDEGRAYSLIPCSLDDLLPLRTKPLAA